MNTFSAHRACNVADSPNTVIDMVVLILWKNEQVLFAAKSRLLSLKSIHVPLPDFPTLCPPLTPTPTLLISKNFPTHQLILAPLILETREYLQGNTLITLAINDENISKIYSETRQTLQTKIQRHI